MCSQHGPHTRLNAVLGPIMLCWDMPAWWGHADGRKAWLGCAGGAWHTLPGGHGQPAGLSPQTGPNTVGTTQNKWQPAWCSPQAGACAGCLIRLQHKSCRFLSSAAEQLTEGRGRGALGCRACVVACRQGQPIGPRAPSWAVVAAGGSLHPLQAGLTT